MHGGLIPNRTHCTFCSASKPKLHARNWKYVTFDQQQATIDLPSIRATCSTSDTISLFAISTPLPQDDMPEIPTAFHLFSSLPTELRLQIWALAHLPRIIHLQQLNPYRDEVFGGPFHKLPQHNPYPKSSDKLTHGYVWVSASGCYQPSPVTFVCKEAFEAVNTSYEKLFSHQFGYPQLWFNFAIDTLYLDWGWVGDSLPYTNFDLLYSFCMVERLRHVALFQRGQDIEDYALDPDDPEQSHEIFIQEILDGFPSLKTLTLVNRRHYDEDAHCLVFFENVQDLRVWEHRKWDWGASSSNPSSWDSQTLDVEVLGRMMQKEDMALPLINTKIVADKRIAERLIEITGGEEKLSILQALNDYWLYKVRWSEEHGINAAGHTGQIEYLKMIIEAWKRDGTEWAEDDHNPERMCIWTAKNLEESLVWMENKPAEKHVADGRAK